jgi:hypothetical protein
MKLIARPKTEEAILADVSERANSHMIINGIIAQAQCCVVHLCGCSTGY